MIIQYYQIKWIIGLAVRIHLWYPVSKLWPPLRPGFEQGFVLEQRYTAN